MMEMWHEMKVFVKVLTIRKVWNVGLLKISFYISRIVKKPILWAYPMAISVEPTTACNLECPACPSGRRLFSRPTGNMKTETFETILASLHPWLLHINFYFQGEPFIHPRLMDWIRLAATQNIYTLVSTNAHFLSKENCTALIKSNLHKLIISIDGMSQEVYEKYRAKGSIHKVFEGIENILEAKTKHRALFPYVLLQWIVFEHNRHELPLFMEYCKKKKLPYQIKTAQVYSAEQLQTLVPKDQRYSRYVLNTTELKIQGPLNNHCWRMWGSCVFTQDGAVVPCCFDKDAHYEMGHIKTQSFRDIWFSEKYKTFRQRILKNRQEIDICTNCSEGAKVFTD